LTRFDGIYLVTCSISEADTEFDTTVGHIEDIIMGNYTYLPLYLILKNRKGMQCHNLCIYRSFLYLQSFCVTTVWIP